MKTWPLISFLAVAPFVASATLIGKVVVAGDEWVFSEYAFAGGLYGFPGDPGNQTTLLDNTLSVLSADSLGTGRILSLEITNHVNLGTSFDGRAAAFGFSVTRVFAEDGAQNYALSDYDIVALTRPYGNTKADCEALYHYVMGGGHLLIRAGTGDDSTDWNPFLPTFGFKLTGLAGPVFPANVPVTGGMPPFTNGVSAYTWSNGNEVLVNGLESAYAVNGSSPYGLMGYFEDDPNVPTPFVYDIVPEPASFSAVLLGLAFLRRKGR